MAQQNLNNQNINPSLIIKEISDQYIRKNFQNLNDYFKNQNQLLDFKFFTQTFTQATDNFKIAHGLKYIPQDIIVTQLVGANMTVNFDKFTGTNLDVSVDGPCVVRFFIGTYWNAPSVANAKGPMFFGGVTSANTPTSTVAPAATATTSSMPSGAILPFGGTLVPDGFLLCDGKAVSRNDFKNLFKAIGTAFGQGDGATTFNVPNTAGMFLRGIAPIPGSGVNLPTITGSGSAFTIPGGPGTPFLATFTAHGIKGTVKVRMTGGALSGLTGGNDYFAYAFDVNTLSFGTTAYGAQSTRRSVINVGMTVNAIALSGANSAVLQVWIDTSADVRTAMASGGNVGATVGSVESDQSQAVTGDVNYTRQTLNAVMEAGGAFTVSSPGLSGDANAGAANFGFYALDSSNVVRAGGESRPKNINVNYIIAV